MTFYRKFGGLIFEYDNSYYTKAEAEKHAAWLRRQGALVRVVPKIAYDYEDTKMRWATYWRGGRWRDNTRKRKAPSGAGGRRR